MAKIIGQEINELYQWFKWNQIKLNDRQKRELKTIFAKAVRKYAQAATSNQNNVH